MNNEHIMLFPRKKLPLKERVEKLEGRMDRIEKQVFPVSGKSIKIKRRVKLRKCPNPFDPSHYEYKPTKDELKNLERIMLEEK